MKGVGETMKRRRSGFMTASLLLVLLAGGCASSSSGPSPSASEHLSGFSGSTSLLDLFSNSSAKAPQTVVGAQPDVNCPPVEVRRGASTLTIAPPGDNSAMSVQYQGEFTREARDCTLSGGDMVMRIGVQGRVVVGPRGGPGQVDVPLRIAIVDETPAGTRPVVTKFIIVPVTVTSLDASPIFTHVEDAITFPLPTPTTELYNYVAYVGFDPVSAAAQAKSKPKAKPKSKSKPKQAVSSQRASPPTRAQ